MSDTGITKRSPLLLDWTPSPEWMDRAACAEDHDPEAWFRKDPGEAKAVCAWCPVQQTCRTYALENRIDHGTWGYLTEDERRAMTATRPRPGFVRGVTPPAA